MRAEEAVSKLAGAVSGDHGLGLGQNGDLELKQQLSQLNLPDLGSSPGSRSSALPASGMSQSRAKWSVSGAGDGHGNGNGNGNDSMNGHGSGNCNTANTVTPKLRSNLYSPYPPNLPLALLRLMEAYVLGLSEVDEAEGGWTDSKRERGLALIKDLTMGLGNAERLSSSECSIYDGRITLFLLLPRPLQRSKLTHHRSSTSAVNDPPIASAQDLPRCFTCFPAVCGIWVVGSAYFGHFGMVFSGLGSFGVGGGRGLWTIR
jgi:hypothetical protein